MATKLSTYPLRLPVSLKSAVEKFSKKDRTSINQFVVVAVAEKLSALNTAAFFEERRAEADYDAFRKILTRRGGEPPDPAMNCRPPESMASALGRKRRSGGEAGKSAPPECQVAGWSPGPLTHVRGSEPRALPSRLDTGPTPYTCT